MKPEQEHAKKKPSDYIRQGWCQGAYARDASGQRIAVNSKDAVAWCLAGSLDAATEGSSEYVEATSRVRAILREGFAVWNDAPGRTQQQVIELAVWNDAPGRTQQQVIELLESVGL